MARKTMAERYATQRSRKVTRRRTLPRLSDTATALQERDYDEVDADDEASTATSTFTAGRLTATSTPGATGSALRPAGATGAAGAAMPRRSDRAARYAGLAAAAATRADYSYVRRDLRRIAITFAVMLVLLVALNIILAAVVH